jgi:hypothetical protein
MTRRQKKKHVLVLFFNKQKVTIKELLGDFFPLDIGYPGWSPNT